MSSDGVQTFRVAAAAYDSHVGRYGSELAQGLLAFAGVGAGDSVLEVGSGTGLLTAESAVAVGAAGQVVAVEPSPPFAAASRRRVPSARVQQARGEGLPFADGVFDAALPQLVVNFMADPVAGVRQMRRVTRPGGVVACSVWDYAGEMTLLRTFWDAAVAIDASAEAADEGRTMPYCDPESLGQLWEQAGLVDVEVTELRVSVRYASFEELWQPFTHGVAPSGAYVARLDDVGRAKLRDEYYLRLGRPTGPFTLTARAWAARGRH